MSYTLIPSDEATADILEGIDWYNEQKTGLGRLFYEILWQSFELIEQMPFAYAVRYKNLRACPLKKFPFLVYYFVDKDTKVVTVVAVLHTKRDWKNRL